MGEALGIGLQFNSTAISMLDRIPRELFQFGEILCDTFAAPLDTGYLIDPYSSDLFDRLVSNYRVEAHGNYGQDFGDVPLEDTVVMRRHVPIAQRMGAAWYTNHMFFGTRASSYMWSSPLQFSRAEADRAADRAAKIQDKLGIPLLTENAFYYAPVPGSDLPEAEFVRRFVERSGTWLLLDVHNIFANSRNFERYDTAEFLRDYPLDRVVEVHVAGGQHIDGWYHDLHNSEVPEGTWELLRYVLENGPNVRGVVLEVQHPSHNAQSRAYDDSWVDMTVRDLTRANAIWREVRS